ncbi:bifunctional phosphoribosyl-AMP cyclohydrolase/phosphoribosyl-ATP diphosphatase HisIE [uncultured Ferrimonas sp.]|uniref:bifunctional phosphoribosyl-AMP cyclohydrolase/phosphoribosyl-ATP diphosphatase HisIE n=1 Tax=uncultured Ferrimonas sp. TaxID=432640 RepID=UPI00260AB3AB|nr:bifunctional phosphoribosyl-AMP cyclohydrolase/phosphoribosyl-ATP diphosphatase HisIE [uncultured Ferrimonas sp.]
MNNTPTLIRPTIDWDKVDNMVPAIVQHHLTGQVLMQGYMNPDALQRTLDSGLVTFYSRSKQRLWTKGEESGNVLKLVTLGTDCDNDSLLLQVLPQGPTCHLGSNSCFADRDNQPLLGKLAQVIASRRDSDPASSYTAQLLQGPPRRVAQKVGEEGVEVALAAATNDTENLKDEAADLLYHLSVLLEQQQVGLDEVMQVLLQRAK